MSIDPDPIATQVLALVDRAQERESLGGRAEALGNEISATLGPGGWFGLILDDGPTIGAVSNAPLDVARGVLGLLVGGGNVGVALGKPSPTPERLLSEEERAQFVRRISEVCPTADAALVVWFGKPRARMQIFVTSNLPREQYLSLLAEWLDHEAATESGEDAPS